MKNVNEEIKCWEKHVENDEKKTSANLPKERD